MITVILSVAMIYAVIAICKFFPTTAVAKFFEAICTDEDKFYAPKNDVKSSLTHNKAA